MKKTFISLFILSLLTVFGSLSVKADTTLSFVYSSTGQDYHCNGSSSDKDKGITDSDFRWSDNNKDNVKNVDVSGDKWTGVKSDYTACSRNTYSFCGSSCTLNLLINQLWDDVERSLPSITINGNTYYAAQATWGESNTETIVDNKFNFTYSRSTRNTPVTFVYNNVNPGTGAFDISVYFPNGDADKFLVKTLTITQNAATYDVAATASNGSVSGTGSYAEGAEVTLTASPNENYSFTGWSSSDISIADASANPLVFTMPGNAVSVTANFTECTKHTVTLTAGDNGSVSGGGEQCDGSVTVTATPNSGFRFVNWTNTSTSEVVSTNAEYTFTLSADISLTANFEVNPCTNTKTIQCENTYLTTSTGITVIDGNEAHATPSEIRTASSITTYNGTGYVTLKDASGNGHTGDIFFAFTLYEEANCDITIRYAEANANSYANIFKKVDALTGDISYNGKYYDKISYHRIGGENNWSWPGNFTDWEFTEEDLDATDYILVICNSEGKISLDQITFTASENIFCPNTITMAKSGDDGAAAPTAQVNSSNVTTAFEGTEVTITAGEASANHYFSGWTVSPENAVTFADQTNATTTFVMPEADVTITANYGAVVLSEFTYTISGSGTIDCATANGSDVPSGTVITLTAEPSTDYVFRGWTATAGTFGDDAALTTTFTMPAEAATVTATFAQVDNKIITGSEATVIEENGDATLTVTSVSDFDAFNHNVLKFAYSNMAGKYKGQKVAIDAGYSSASSAGATGFGFYYKTEKADDNVAFCFDTGDGQVKWELQATNNVWKYYYFAHAKAASWKHSGIIIYMNGDDTGNHDIWNEQATHTTYKDGGAFYMSDIAATSITSKPDIANYLYTNDRGGAMKVGDYGTLCLPMDGTIEGATLYSVAGKETGGDISYLVLEDQGTNVVAGKPYITQSTATSYTVTMSGAHSAVQDGNGLVGTYELINPLTPYNESGPHNYFLYANAFKKAGTGVTVGDYRAYLDWDEVSAAPAQAPSARRIRMVIEGTEAQTGMETVTAMPKTTKVLIDGQLFIIREGKRYTLTGARAQ